MKIVENRKVFFGISFVILMIAVTFAIINASKGKGIFNFDVDFSGGASIQYELGEEAEERDVEAIVSQAADVQTPRVQKIIGTTQVVIRLQAISNEQRDDITKQLKEKYTGTELLANSDVSSTISAEMQQKALTAVIIACIAMLLYISIRFKDIKMGASAIAALAHDMLVMLAVYIVFRVPVNSSFIAAILTILGYSINATIVVFDRIRENKRFVKRHELELLINSSVTQTLARSINTSVTTLLTITCVYIFGVTSVRDFAFPLIIGIISGAYSSVCFAGSIWYTLCTRKKNVNKTA